MPLPKRSSSPLPSGLCWRPALLPCCTSLLLLCTALLLLCATTLVAQENWTRFRGANGQGISNAEKIPVSWTADDYNWRTRLPGGGNSSPVVFKDRVFLLAANAENAKRYVVCIDGTSGREVWNREYQSTPHRLHARNTFATSTPAVDEMHVYVAWSKPDQTTLMALTHNGEEVWTRDFGPWVSSHGFGTSPIVYGDLVIVSNSQQASKLKSGVTPGVSSMIAVNRKTGKDVWQTPRTSDVASYCVPCIYRDPNDGRDQLICCSSADGMYSLDPTTGKQNWAVPDLFKLRTVASPVEGNGMLFASNGSGGGGNYVVAIKPGSNMAAEVYRVDKSANYVPTPVVCKGRIYLWYDKGIVHCVNIADGSTVWRERVEGEFSGSPILVQDRMYCIADSGEVFVVGTGDKFELLAVNSLEEPSRSTPAVAGERMFLRSDTHLMSIGG